MEDLIQALKSYKSMAADMAEFADEDHLERNDKISVVIKLQNGTLAFSVAMTDAMARVDMDYFAKCEAKYLSKIVMVIKERLAKVMDTSDQIKLWSHFLIIADQFELLIEALQSNNDSSIEWKFKHSIGTMYFHNEIA